MAWLVQRKGPSPGRIYQLRTGMVTVGRDDVNTIQILDSYLSRQHFMIRFQSQNYVLDDLNSANGVFINGRKTRRRILCQGDTIQVGRTQFEFTLARPRDYTPLPLAPK